MKYLTAILHTAIREPDTKGQFLKYRNIPNKDRDKSKFINDMKKKFPSADYVNWYDKETGEGRGQTIIV